MDRIFLAIFGGQVRELLHFGGVGEASLALVTRNAALGKEFDNACCIGQRKEALSTFERAHPCLKRFVFPQFLGVGEQGFLEFHELFGQRQHRFIGTAASDAGRHQVEFIAHEIAELIGNLAIVDEIVVQISARILRKLRTDMAGERGIFDQLYLGVGVADQIAALSGLADNIDPLLASWWRDCGYRFALGRFAGFTAAARGESQRGDRGGEDFQTAHVIGPLRVCSLFRKKGFKRCKIMAIDNLAIDQQRRCRIDFQHIRGFVGHLYDGIERRLVCKTDLGLRRCHAPLRHNLVQPEFGIGALHEADDILRLQQVNRGLAELAAIGPLRLCRHQLPVVAEETPLAAAARQQGCCQIHRVAHQVADFKADLAGCDKLVLDLRHVVGLEMRTMAAGVACIFNQLGRSRRVADDVAAFGSQAEGQQPVALGRSRDQRAATKCRSDSEKGQRFFEYSRESGGHICL